MVTLGMLWMPILLATVVVFFASFLAWMVLPHHRPDWVRLPEEDEVLSALREHGVKPGQYHFPFAGSPKEMATEDMIRKLKRGPAGFLIVQPAGVPNMANPMLFSFLHDLMISLLVAYVLAHSLQAGAEYLAVFRLAGTAALLGYGGALAVNSIWFGRSWTSTLKEIADAVAYALLTAGCFAALWPS